MPYNVVINSNCNLSCGYCFAKEILSNKNSIDLNTIDYVINFLKNSNHKIISLLGGEPTLHPEIFQIINRFEEEGFTVSVKSNGLWENSLNKYFATKPDKSLFFLLNLNQPSSYSIKQLQTIDRNLSFVQNQNIVLSCNIDNPEFNFDYVLDYAKNYSVKYIRWSFAHPIYQNQIKRIHQNYFPIDEYHDVSERIVEFVKSAGELGIMTLGDHSVIRCMFSENQISQIYMNNGEINCKCEGTIDILPDLQVIYCLPMYSLFEKSYLSNYIDINDLEMHFESKIIPLRSCALPFSTCENCKFFKSEECHGGCLSHRIFPLKDLETFYKTWDYHNLKDEKLILSSDLKFEMINEHSKISTKTTEIKVSNIIIQLLNQFKKPNSISSALNSLRIDYCHHREEIEEFIDNCHKYRLLEITHEY